MVDLGINNKGALDPGELIQEGVLHRGDADGALLDIDNVIGTNQDDRVVCIVFATLHTLPACPWR